MRPEPDFEESDFEEPDFEESDFEESDFEVSEFESLLLVFDSDDVEDESLDSFERPAALAPWSFL